MLSILRKTPLQVALRDRLNRYFLKATANANERRRFDGEVNFWAQVLTDQSVEQLRRRYERRGSAGGTPEWFAKIVALRSS